MLFLENKYDDDEPMSIAGTAATRNAHQALKIARRYWLIRQYH